MLFLGAIIPVYILVVGSVSTLCYTWETSHVQGFAPIEDTRQISIGHHTELDRLRLIHNFRIQFYGVYVPNNQLYRPEIGNEKLVRRVLTTPQLRRNMNDLDTEIKDWGEAAKAVRNLHNFSPKAKDELTTLLDIDIKNKDIVFVNNQAHRNRIEKEVQELIDAGRSEDGEMYKKKADKWYKTFITYWKDKERAFAKNQQQIPDTPWSTARGTRRRRPGGRHGPADFESPLPGGWKHIPKRQ